MPAALGQSAPGPGPQPEPWAAPCTPALLLGPLGVAGWGVLGARGTVVSAVRGAAQDTHIKAPLNGPAPDAEWTLDALEASVLYGQSLACTVSR